MSIYSAKHLHQHFSPSMYNSRYMLPAYLIQVFIDSVAGRPHPNYISVRRRYLRWVAFGPS